jgi:hypothetical protein
MLRIGSVEKSSKGLRVVENEIPAQGMIFITTTTRNLIDWELATRVIEIELSHNPTLMREIYRLKLREKPDFLEEELAIWQAADTLLEPAQVVIPYEMGLAIAEAFPVNEERFARDFEKVLLLIKASALLHQYQRQKDEKGRIVATVKDYEIVYGLRGLIFQGVYDERVIDFVSKLKELGLPITKKEIQAVLGLSEGTTRRRLIKPCTWG